MKPLVAALTVTLFPLHPQSAHPRTQRGSPFHQQCECRPSQCHCTVCTALLYTCSCCLTARSTLCHPIWSPLSSMTSLCTRSLMTCCWQPQLTCGPPSLPLPPPPPTQKSYHSPYYRHSPAIKLVLCVYTTIIHIYCNDWSHSEFHILCVC